jgi:hypothetical protein
MNLPHADLALIEQTKVVDYLLNPEHSENGGEADFFFALGFRPGGVVEVGGGTAPGG